MKALTYVLHSDHKMEDIREEDREYLGDDYKRKVGL